MYEQPLEAVEYLTQKKPHLIIIHAEANYDLEKIIDICKASNIKIGITLLQKTPPRAIKPYLNSIDHVLIFSGNLGHQGGSTADLNLLDKIKEIKDVNPNIEIGWDGGVNYQNVAQLVNSDVEVINVGGFIQAASEPEKTFTALQRIADETGTT
jgi:ribulose-phosphate 3-epimerase